MISQKIRFVLAGLIVAAALPSSAMAACTEADAEAKIKTLGELITPMLAKDPSRAERISNEMTAGMMLDGDASCVHLDKTIAAAR